MKKKPITVLLMSLLSLANVTNVAVERAQSTVTKITLTRHLLGGVSHFVADDKATQGFVERATSDVIETQTIKIMVTSISFCNVKCDTDSSAAHLTNQIIFFFRW